MGIKDIKLEIGKVYQDIGYDAEGIIEGTSFFVIIVHILPSFEEDEDESKTWKTAVGISVSQDKNKKWSQRSWSNPYLYDSMTGARRCHRTGLRQLIELGTTFKIDCKGGNFEEWIEKNID